jgi:phage shock protein PspC (stress-responsive transcriptional regulator)
MMDRDQQWRASASVTEWHRDFPDRRVAGVCAGLAHQLGVPLILVRAGFILGTVLPGMHLAGPVLYAAFWLLMPSAPAGPSGLDRLLDGIHGLRDLREDWADTEPREPRKRYGGARLDPEDDTRL